MTFKPFPVASGQILISSPVRYFIIVSVGYNLYKASDRRMDWVSHFGYQMDDFILISDIFVGEW